MWCITEESRSLVDESEESVLDYDNYIEILALLNDRQLENICVNIHTRFDRTLRKEDGSTDWDKMRDEARKKLKRTPKNLRCLLGCPMIVLRYEQFEDYLNEIRDVKKAVPSEVFWGFVERFPIKTYYRAVRVRPGQEVNFYSGMLNAPRLQPEFRDYGDATYPPVVGDFEGRFTYHVYLNRSTQGSLVSWTEQENVALFAATLGVEEYDPDWSADNEGAVFVMQVRANSFFFVDETEVNKSSSLKPGEESILVMSLPFRAIENGGMAFHVYSKEDIPLRIEGMD